MKAITRNQYGPPEVLQLTETEKPNPAANEILIKVYAATVNRTDCGILTGKPVVIRLFTGLSRPKTVTTGTDFAGLVEATGSEVTQFKPGDRVFGFDDNGLASHAEYLTITTKKGIAIIPGSISFEQGAASLEGAHYAYNFINKVKLKTGDKVMVNGSTGAIGSALVQFLKYQGAYVTATCNTKNLELIKSLGVDRIIDYTREDFTKDKEKYHYVFDAVGKSTFGRCKRLLLPNGIYISSEPGPGSQNPFLAIITPISGGKKVVFPIPTNIPRSMKYISDLLEKDKFKPVIDRKYSLDQTPEAFKYVASGQKTGNAVILINNN